MTAFSDTKTSPKKTQTQTSVQRPWTVEFHEKQDQKNYVVIYMGQHLSDPG